MLCAGKLHLPGPRGRRNEAIPGLTLCKACSWRKLVLGLLLNKVLALGGSPIRKLMTAVARPAARSLVESLT